MRGRKKTLAKIHLYYLSESVCRVKINVSWKQYCGEIILHASEFYQLSVEMNGIENMMRHMQRDHDNQLTANDDDHHDITNTLDS